MSNQEEIKIPANLSVNVEFTVNEWTHILSAIDELPRRIANGLHDKINQSLVKAANEFSGPKPKELKPAK